MAVEAAGTYTLSGWVHIWRGTSSGPSVAMQLSEESLHCPNQCRCPLSGRLTQSVASHSSQSGRAVCVTTLQFLCLFVCPCLELVILLPICRRRSNLHVQPFLSESLAGTTSLPNSLNS